MVAGVCESMLGSVRVRFRGSRTRLRRRLTRIGLFALVLALLPKQAAFDDLGALLARQPGVTARAHKFLLTRPHFGVIHTATFSLPRPIGTRIPHPPVYALANFDPSDIAASIGAQFLGDPTAPLQFPAVNRKDKAELVAGEVAGADATDAADAVGAADADGAGRCAVHRRQRRQPHRPLHAI